MSIKSVKVTMSSVGVHAGDAPRKVMYMPIAKIDYIEKRTSQPKSFSGQ